LPAGRKQRSATASARGPEIRITASPASPSGVAMAAMVSSNMPAIAFSVLRVPALQEQPRLFVTLLVEVMEQARIGAPRQLAGQFVKPREQWLERGFRTGGRHAFDGRL